MDMELSPLQARVIGCLIEKEASTPEHYPLSLNALTNACNQKSNREPVMKLDESEVQQTLDALIKKHWVSEKSGFGSRVVKYQHRFFNSEFGGTRFTPQQMAVVCELMLRGPQTPGELRSRTARLCKFTEVSEVEQALNALMHHPEGPFIARLPREPGRREARYAQLFCGPVEGAETGAAVTAAQPVAASEHARLEQLEHSVAALRRELDALKRQLGQT
ncbi:hypothetical protein Tel_15300 [Candidatus Tenderia electrophaga]|jgi:hypothetical protein|uniref:Uncharacterized protein n=1 Tax=Candidatus Tenderia electrophaga TaxID=1748243 RepID=A0A0S2TGY8_9GAMM|nr:hypothetical protein Tel_15300 [Candidatus Tenderia electrophaga]